MTIKIYNTLGREILPFSPLNPKWVGIYACGPTVYNYAHIGNLRTYLNEDSLRRMIEYSGLKVKHVMNITDVGHLVSDEDEGDDKMELSAQKEKLSIWDLAEKYTTAFKNDLTSLNILFPHVWCKATDHIAEQIALIQKLEELGFTYVIEDGVYYDTSRFPQYGELGGQDLSELLGGARVKLSGNKRNVTDFALWKFSPSEHKRLMEWESPWGKGFPGWHIECSAMAMKYLGKMIDIHCGGVDHVKVHHTNEVAQVVPVINQKWVNFWFHSEFLIEKDGKMSKSKGEFLTLSLLSSKGYHPLAYRYYALGCHYRSKMSFTYENMDGAQSGYQKLLLRMQELQIKAVGQSCEQDQLKIIRQKIQEVIFNDLNTPQLLAFLWILLKDEQYNEATKWEAMIDFDKLLGLKLREVTAVEEIPTEVQALVTERQEAKKGKDFSKADLIRKEILDLGYIIEDSPSGTKVRKKSL